MYKELISPMLDRLDSETWHTRARELLHLAEMSPATLKILERLFADQGERFEDDRLNIILGGIELENPLIVGAGWDKAGRAVKALHRLGFAGVEVGTVLQYPQPGNPRPRQFILGPGVALNRLGFNSPGMDVVGKNVEEYRDSGIPIGISVGKNKDVPDVNAPEAHTTVIRRLYDHAAYFTLNVSSPNTPGLRKLQDKEPLKDNVQACQRAMDHMGGRKPLFVKIAPDLTWEALDDVIEVAVDEKVTGIIATNTTVNAGIKAKYGEKWRNEAGGVSGNDPDFRQMATETIAHIFRQAGDRIEIIGVGGVNDTTTALEKIRAGAKALQIVTAIRGEGPTLPGKINRGLAVFMEQEGIRNITELVGTNVNRVIQI